MRTCRKKIYTCIVYSIAFIRRELTINFYQNSLCKLTETQKYYWKMPRHVTEKVVKDCITITDDKKCNFPMNSPSLMPVTSMLLSERLFKFGILCCRCAYRCQRISAVRSMSRSPHQSPRNSASTNQERYMMSRNVLVSCYNVQ